MATYPLTLPENKSFKTLTMRSRNAVGITQAPHSYAQQTQDFGGQIWEAEATLPIMKRRDGEPWQAFLNKLNGPAGTFLSGRPDAKRARGAGADATDLQVNGGAQTGQSLAIKSATLGDVPGLLLTGDLFQIGSGLTAHLHAITDDVDMVDGEAMLLFWPALRFVPANNAPLIVANAVGLWRLVNPAPEFMVDEAGNMQLQPLPIREAI